MPAVKFLNGKIAEYEEKDLAELSRAILAEEKDGGKILELIPNENACEDGVDFFAFFVFKTLFILNLTQKNYFAYDRQNSGDTGYNAILRDLFAEDLSGLSHWRPNDRVIFVPDHLRNYVAAAYGQLKI